MPPGQEHGCGTDSNPPVPQVAARIVLLINVIQLQHNFTSSLLQGQCLCVSKYLFMMIFYFLHVGPVYYSLYYCYFLPEHHCAQKMAAKH